MLRILTQRPDIDNGLAPGSAWDNFAQAVVATAHDEPQNGSGPAPQPFWQSLQHALIPVEECPRIVPNIEAVHQTTRKGTPYVVIHNAYEFSYLKLEPREYELMALMDGTRSVKALVVEYFQRYGVLSPPRILGLVQLLRAHYFLAEPPLDVSAALRKKLKRGSAESIVNRIARGFVYSDLSLQNTDQMLGRLYRAVGWPFFTRPAVWLGMLLTLIGPVLYLLEINRERYPVLTIGGSYLTAFVILTALELITLTIHELGHAMAVKHAGRAVPRGGFLLYYGFPAGYVDTTDIWMAPRRQRLITSFAGPYTGLALGGLLGLLSFALPESSLGGFFFAWGFVLYVNTLLNFNPLLELDGYYLVVDWLEIPSLRARAFAFVRGPLWERLRKRVRLTREEAFFALFGLSSFAYSLLALFAALRFWEYRLERYIVEAFVGGDVLTQIGLVLVTTLVTIPLALALWAFLKRVLTSIALELGWLGLRATTRRHRAQIDAIRAVPLWANLPEPRVLEMARAMRVRHVPAGAEVVRQGEAGDRFYVIAEGTFEVRVDDRAVRTLGRGGYFGETALLNRAPRNATVAAQADATILSLDQASFQAWLARDLQTRAQLETAMTYRADVADMPLFRDLSAPDLDLVLTHMTPVSVRAGTELIRQGEKGDQFYVIRSGAVEVLRDGRSLARCGRGDSVGEIALLLDLPRTATVRAIENTGLLSMSATDFKELLAGYLGRTGRLTQLSDMRLATHGVRQDR